MADTPRFTDTRFTIGLVPRDAGIARDEAKVRVFAREIQRQCRFGRRSGRAMLAAARSHLDSESRDAVVDAKTAAESVWFHAQAFLNAMAVLSRIFLGDDVQGERPNRAAQKAAGLARGQYLRAEFAVDDESPILDRAVRNHFEHIDERLDGLIADGAPEVHQDSSIIPPGGVRMRIFADPEYVTEVLPLRELDLEAGLLVFRDLAVDVDAVLVEFERIETRASEVLSRPPVKANSRIGIFGRTEYRDGRAGWVSMAD